MARTRRKKARRRDRPTAGEWSAILLLATSSFLWLWLGAPPVSSLNPVEAQWSTFVVQNFDPPESIGSLFPTSGIAGVDPGAHSPNATATGGVDPRVRLGRIISAAFGGLALVLVWWVLRSALPRGLALWGTAWIAVSPLFTAYNRTLGEDMAGLAAGLVATICLARLLERPERSRAILLGAVVGVASTIALRNVLLAPLCAAAPLLAPAGRRPELRRSLAVAAPTALATFAITQMVTDWIGWPGEGILSEIWRSLEGEHLYVSALRDFFAFHLRHNLLPGLTLPGLLMALAGIPIAVSRRHELPTLARVVLLQGALVWLFCELSPRKPLPGSASYLLPLLPAAGLSVGLLVRWLEEKGGEGALGRAFVWAAVALLLLPAARSVEAGWAVARETRLAADAWVERNASRPLRERLSSGHPAEVPSLATVDIEAARRDGITHLVASSFVYDTFARGSRRAGQAPYVYDRHERYQALFAYPYVEFASVRPDLGWNNPTIRVIDIQTPPPPGRPESDGPTRR